LISFCNCSMVIGLSPGFLSFYRPYRERLPDSFKRRLQFRRIDFASQACNSSVHETRL
jgi:hypothetical protein